MYIKDKNNVIFLRHIESLLQAISRVTQVISGGNYEDLNGLLTRPARLSLQRELERNWNGRHRVLLALKHEDIQISSPRKVYFIRIAGALLNIQACSLYIILKVVGLLQTPPGVAK